MASLAVQVFERHPLPVGVSTLQRILDDTQSKVRVFEQIIRDFGERYGCDLASFEAKIEAGQLPEHPAWEESIEWGVAEDELKRLQDTQRVLGWILGLLG